MGTPERQPYSPVRQDLFDAFFEFSFFKAVHLLETLNPEKKRIGEAFTPDQEAVRFGVRPGFIFPASDIAGLRPPVEDEKESSSLPSQEEGNADTGFPLPQGEGQGEGRDVSSV